MIKARLFCKHCEKHYEVNKDFINLIQKHQAEQIKYERNTYYFDNGGCFFKTLKQLQALNQ